MTAKVEDCTKIVDFICGSPLMRYATPRPIQVASTFPREALTVSLSRILFPPLGFPSSVSTSTGMQAFLNLSPLPSGARVVTVMGLSTMCAAFAEDEKMRDFLINGAIAYKASFVGFDL